MANPLEKADRNREIVRRYGLGESITSLAKEHRVSDQTVWNIVQRSRAGTVLCVECRECGDYVEEATQDDETLWTCRECGV